MQADRNDRINAEETRSRHGTQTIVTAIAVLILAGGAYILMPGQEDDGGESESIETAPVVVAPEPVLPDPVEVAPDIPEPVEPIDEPLEEVVEAVVEEPEPPTQEELDDGFRQSLDEAGVPIAASLHQAVSSPFLLDRSVSAIDQLARGYVPTRALNLPDLSEKFAVQREGSNYRVDPKSYSRYDRLVDAVTSVPVESVSTFFHRYRGALSEGYALLGYPADEMDNALVAALDGIISAPIRTEAPYLTSKGALWAYSEDSLENASDLHKQLLRTGPENTRALKAWASSLRSTLLDSN